MIEINGEDKLNSPETEGRHLLVALMGVPASGKSTLAGLLGEGSFGVVEEGEFFGCIFDEVKVFPFYSDVC